MNDHDKTKQQLPEYSRLPPQAKPLEAAILSAIMVDKKAIGEVYDLLKPQHFYVDANGIIYRAMFWLYERSHPIDLLSVMNRLEKTGELETVGGPSYLAELSSKVTSSSSIEYHARIVYEKYVARHAIEVYSDMVDVAYSQKTDVFDLLEKSADVAVELGQKVPSAKRTAFATVGREVMNQIIDGRANGVDSNAKAYTGLKDLDTMSTGMHSGDLIILAARPAMGKTSLLLQLARTITQDTSKAVAVFSLEMSAEQLAGSMICSQARVDKKNIRNWSKLSDTQEKQMDIATKELENQHIYIFDKPGITHLEFGAEVKKLRVELMKKGVELTAAFVDYLQLMGGNQKDKSRSYSREQEVSSFSRGLKASAKDNDIPVIALSQLSRSVETRGGDKRPILSDLRESGAIEQDADQVWFLYRPEYYRIFEDNEGNSLKGVAEVIVGKNRHGEVGSVPTRFKIQYGIFEDYEWDFDLTEEETDNKENPAIDDPSKVLEDDDELPF